MDIAELLVKYGLPLILFTLLILIIISVIMIKLMMKKNYFDYVTEKLLHLSDWEIEVVELVKTHDQIFNKDTNQKMVHNDDNQISVPSSSSSPTTSLIVNENETDSNNKDTPDRRAFINFQCYYIRIDPCSIFIQFPYLTRFLSYILFWGYFSIQTLCLEEIFSDSILDGYKCFNVSIKLTGKLYRY